MGKHGTALDRRQFLRQSAALGLGAFFAPDLVSRVWAASRDRMVIYQGVSLDSLHPYGYSGGGITGIWRHMLEPLIQMDYDRNEYVGVLAVEMFVVRDGDDLSEHGLFVELDGWRYHFLKFE